MSLVDAVYGRGVLCERVLVHPLHLCFVALSWWPATEGEVYSAVETLERVDVARVDRGVWK